MYCIPGGVIGGNWNDWILDRAKVGEVYKIHTHTAVSTVIMLQQNLMYFLCIFQYHIVRNNIHKWVQICIFIQRRKKRTLNKMGCYSKCTRKYSWSHTEISWQTSHTFFGSSQLWDTGQRISISIPWVCLWPSQPSADKARKGRKRYWSSWLFPILYVIRCTCQTLKDWNVACSR